MKLSQVVIGETYIAKVSGGLTRVRVDRIEEGSGWNGRSCTRIICTNIKTGRKIICRSPQRLRPLVLPGIGS